MNKRRLLPAVLLLVLVSCADDDLRQVAMALRNTAESVAVLEDTVIQANALKLVSDDATRQTLLLSVRINEAGRQAVAITRNLERLAPQDRQNLLRILSPVLEAVRTSNVVNVINDPKTRSDVSNLLLVIETSLNAAQLALAVN